MPDASLVTALAGWLLTYWLHSAIAIAGACLGAHWLRRPAERDVLWRVALVLPLLSATLAAVANPSRVGAWRAVRAADVMRATAPGRWAPVQLSVDVRDVNGQRTESTQMIDPLADMLARWIVALAALVGGVALTVHIDRHRELRRSMRDRRLLDRETLEAPLALALGDPSWRLFEAPALDAPVAVGARDICLPIGFWTLSPTQQTTILEHEAEHLRRRDPTWFAVADSVAALLAIQPLTRLVVRRMRRDAEFICDDAAVRRTGAPLELIASLARFAAVFDPLADPAVLGAPYRGSPVIERASRILKGERGSGAPRRAWLVGIAFAMALLVTAAAPVVVTRGEARSRPPGAQRESIETERVTR